MELSHSTTNPGVSQDPNATSDWTPPAPLNDNPTLADLKASLEYAHNNIDVLKGQLQRCSAVLADHDRNIARLRLNHADLLSYTHDLEEYLITLDTNARKKNLIVSGFDESLNETPEVLIIKLTQFFSTYVDTLEMSDIETAFRLGVKPKNNKDPRSLLVKFHSESMRNKVSQIRLGLDDDNSKRKVYLNDDLPKVENERRAVMRLVIKEAKIKGIPAKMTGSKMMVNNITYDFHNLHCLPKDLRVESIKTKEHDGDLVFQSEHSWLSNFFPTPISLQGINFHSAEHAFQYAKACRNKQPDMASLILNTKTAKAAKKLGWGVERNKEWDQQKDEVMVRIVNAKFRQNPTLTRKLILTGSKRLVEATMDRYWGAFATPNAKSIVNKTWKGANRLGLILMDLRDELRREHPRPSYSWRSGWGSSAYPITIPITSGLD